MTTEFDAGRIARAAPTPEPATATVPYEPGPTEQLRRGFDEEGPHDLLCDCPPCCSYHAATQKPEPATGSGEAKCDRCFNRYPVLFSMCRPCMDEVAPPSIQPTCVPNACCYGFNDVHADDCDVLTVAITRARAEGRSELAKEAAKVCRDAQAEWQENAEMTKPGEVINARDRLQGQANAARVLAGQIERLAATPDGGAAKGTGK